MDQEWQKVKTSPMKLFWAPTSAAGWTHRMLEVERVNLGTAHAAQPTEVTSLGDCWSPGLLRRGGCDGEDGGQGRQGAGWTSPAVQGVCGLALPKPCLSGPAVGAPPGLSRGFLSSRSGHTGSVAVAGPWAGLGKLVQFSEHFSTAFSSLNGSYF